MATGNPLTMQVLDALARGDKIGAIRLMREAGAPSLRAALQAIEAQGAKAPATSKQAPPLAAKAPVQQVQRARPPTVAMGDPPGQLRWLLAVVVMLVAAVWIGLGNGI